MMISVCILGDTMYEEEEDYYQDSEPEEPLYNRQELMEKYHVSQALDYKTYIFRYLLNDNVEKSGCELIN